jgi:SAM-dependent methyltransferase
MDKDGKDPDADEHYAEAYDASVPDWPGEIDFYREMADEANSAGGAVLEVACGTGRVAIRLAQSGARVVGIDLSPQMLEVARQNSLDVSNVRWIEADIRSFELAERFSLALIPGHAFQNLNAPQDQAACLGCVKRHLRPGGVLVVHPDHMNAEKMKWLGGLSGDQRGILETAEQFPQPGAGNQVRASRAWFYEPATQTAVVPDGLRRDGPRWTDPESYCGRTHSTPLCVLLRDGAPGNSSRVRVEAVYGDFFRHELEDDSPSMIWVAKRP